MNGKQESKQGHSQSVNHGTGGKLSDKRGYLDAEMLPNHRNSTDNEFNNKGNRRLKPAGILNNKSTNRLADDGEDHGSKRLDSDNHSSKSLDDIEVKRTRGNPKSADR